MRGRWSRRLCYAVFSTSAVLFAIGATDRSSASIQPRPIPELNIQLAQAAPDGARLLRDGARLYKVECLDCHGADGEGAAGPKLAGNDFLSSRGRIVVQIFEGNDDHGMPAYYDQLDDRETAAIATFVRSSWGNSYGVVLPEEVGRMR